MIKIKPFLWKKRKGDGTRHIKIYIGKDRDVTYLPLNIYVCCEDLGNDYAQWTPKTVANHIIINSFIRDVMDKLQHLIIMNPEKSILEIKDLYAKKGKEDFYAFYDDQFELKKKKISPETAKSYNQLLASLKEFSPQLGFEKINYEFLSRFEGSLKEKKLQQTTVYKRMKIFKMWVNEAYRMEKIKTNPFHSYKLKDGKSNRTFLDKQALDKIRTENKLNNYESEARTKFLFQCCTGLSYSDLIDLKWSEIRGNIIYRERIKTKEALIIPLIPEAVEILERSPKDRPNIFKRISLQKYNEFLHSIEAKCTLAIPLTSHVARHTFATLALDAGISMAVVSSILGHTNIRTTQIYGKITKSLKEQEMKKLKF